MAKCVALGNDLSCLGCIIGYFNSLYSDLPLKTVQKLQLVGETAVRVTRVHNTEIVL